MPTAKEYRWEAKACLELATGRAGRLGFGNAAATQEKGAYQLYSSINNETD
jgi:hypothetical protein